MTSKQIKQLDKLMTTESKMDERQIERAVKELKKAEKAYEQSVKETKKAQAAYEKAVKQKLKTSKILGKAEEKRAGAATGVEQAERIAAEKHQRENLEDQDLQQRLGQLSEAFHSFDSNERERNRRRSEIIGTSRSSLEPAGDRASM